MARTSDSASSTSPSVPGVAGTPAASRLRRHGAAARFQFGRPAARAPADARLGERAKRTIDAISRRGEETESSRVGEVVGVCSVVQRHVGDDAGDVPGDARASPTGRAAASATARRVEYRVFLQCRQDSPSFATYSGTSPSSVGTSHSSTPIAAATSRATSSCAAGSGGSRRSRRRIRDARARSRPRKRPGHRFRFRPRLRPRRRDGRGTLRATSRRLRRRRRRAASRPRRTRASLGPAPRGGPRRGRARGRPNSPRARATSVAFARASRAWTRPQRSFGSDSRTRDTPPRGCARASPSSPSQPSDRERPRARPCATTARARRRAIRRPSCGIDDASSEKIKLARDDDDDDATTPRRRSQPSAAGTARVAPLSRVFSPPRLDRCRPPIPPTR